MLKMKIDGTDFCITDGGKLIDPYYGELVKVPILNTNGYERVKLLVNRKIKFYYIHQLVAEYFLPIPPELKGKRLCVTHIDGNKSNNNVSNLKWTTFNSVMKEHHKNGVYKNNRSTRIKLIDDLNFNEIEFKSMAEAALYLQSIDPEKYKNIKTVQANIGSAVRNKRRAYGFKWEKISV